MEKNIQIENKKIMMKKNETSARKAGRQPKNKTKSKLKAPTT
jgi:hypothetical protein